MTAVELAEAQAQDPVAGDRPTATRLAAAPAQERPGTVPGRHVQRPVGETCPTPRRGARWSGA